MKPTVGPPQIGRHPNRDFTNHPFSRGKMLVSWRVGVVSSRYFQQIYIYILIFCFDGSWNHRSNPGDKTHPKSVMEFISITLNQLAGKPPTFSRDYRRHPSPVTPNQSGSAMAPAHWPERKTPRSRICRRDSLMTWKHQDDV